MGKRKKHQNCGSLVVVTCYVFEFREVIDVSSALRNNGDQRMSGTPDA